MAKELPRFMLVRLNQILFFEQKKSPLYSASPGEYLKHLKTLYVFPQHHEAKETLEMLCNRGGCE